jgi:MOSC domain-containing protein YiiM
MPAEVISVNISEGGIPKLPQAAVDVATAGLAGDAHDHEKHNTPLQAVSLIDLEDLEDLRAEGFPVGPGATGENITLRGLDVDGLAVGDRLAFDGGLELELTKRRKPCYVLDAIDPQLKVAIAGRCGFYARVLTEAPIAPGARVRCVPTGPER